MKHLALLLMICSWCTAFAYDVMRENVYFNLNREDQTATVTYKKIVPGKARTEYYEVVTIPETIKVKGVKYLVTAIGDSAFFGCDDVDDVIVPQSLRHIGKSAFENFDCKYGESHLYLAMDINTIGERAFANSTITIGYRGHEVTSIGKEAFLNSTIAGYIANERLTSIGEDAFKGCQKLQVVDIGDLKHWCELDFATMNSNPLYMGHRIFRSLRKDPMMFEIDSLWRSISIPEGIETIKTYSFVRADIVELDLPNTLSSIESHAFYECENLLSVHLPASLKKIGIGAFSGCFRLESIIIDSPDIVIEGANFTGFRGVLIVPTGMAEEFRQKPLWGDCTIVEKE